LGSVSALADCIRRAARDRVASRARGGEKLEELLRKLNSRKVPRYRRLLAPGLLLLLAACAQDPSVTGNTVRTCDDTGCSDRPEDQVSYQKKDDAEDREDARIVVLKQAA